MSSTGVTSTSVRDFFQGPAPAESIKVKSKTVEKATVKNEVVEAKENLTMTLILGGPTPEERSLTMTFTPLPSKKGNSVRLTHCYGSEKSAPVYTKDFDTWEPVFDELRMCLTLQHPTFVMLHYKHLHIPWKCHEVLQRKVVEEGLLRTMNKHDCDDGGCDGHDVDIGDFHNFIIDKAQAVIHETMEYDGKYLWKEQLLRDKECPVMMEPLRPGATYKLPCSHFISMEAYDRLVCPRKCPLCRAEVGNGSGTECL